MSASVLVIRDRDSSEVSVSTIPDFRKANKGGLSREESANLRLLLAGAIPEMFCGMGFVLTVADEGAVEPYAAVEGDTESRWRA